MAMEQQREWAEAQKIEVSVDLVEAAKKQLEFLGAVDRNRHLYEGPALERAIYRYNAFWLPLLAKHLENPISEGPLVVPLDCEWIWHCHRLNPVRYAVDCKKLFGRVLGNHNVMSSVEGTSKSATEEIWNKLYPEEPYELDLNRPIPGDVCSEGSQTNKFTSYDLVSAVKRQTSFTYQVSRPHMSDDLFLKEAVARYKGFLHLIRTNRKMKLDRFCVPTYDVDLIWHSHQLHPISYIKDMAKLLGQMLQHDDTDSDRSKGKKLDTGFSATTKQFEETFGLRYLKAGAMHRGNTPTPVTQVPFQSNFKSNKLNASESYDKLIQYPATKAMEVVLEFVDIKNPPEGRKSNLLVLFSKKKPDKLFYTKRSLSLSSESEDNKISVIQCEPTGEFLFELASVSASKSVTFLGTCSLSMRELLGSQTQLSFNKWLQVKPVSGLETSEPILLHVAVSFTPPVPEPTTFHLMSSQPSAKNTFLLPLIHSGKLNDPTYVIDDSGKGVFSLHLRGLTEDATKGTSDLSREVYCFTDDGAKHTLLAEFLGNCWSIKGTCGSFKLQNNVGSDGPLFDLIGYKMAKLFQGRRLDFEPKHCGEQTSEENFVTVVEFSTKYPYGRAVALIDFKTGTLKVMDDWMVLPGITLAYILPDILGIKRNIVSKEIIAPSGMDTVMAHSSGGVCEYMDDSCACGYLGFHGSLNEGMAPCSLCRGGRGGGGTNCSTCGEGMAMCSKCTGGGRCGVQCSSCGDGIVKSTGEVMADCGTTCGGVGVCKDKLGFTLLKVGDVAAHGTEGGPTVPSSDGGNMALCGIRCVASDKESGYMALCGIRCVANDAKLSTISKEGGYMPACACPCLSKNDVYLGNMIEEASSPAEETVAA